jgi:hypothetical protein
MTRPNTMAPPGWYPDPEAPTQLRWFDGRFWAPQSPAPTAQPDLFESLFTTPSFVDLPDSADTSRDDTSFITTLHLHSTMDHVSASARSALARNSSTRLMSLLATLVATVLTLCTFTLVEALQRYVLYRTGSSVPIIALLFVPGPLFWLLAQLRVTTSYASVQAGRLHPRALLVQLRSRHRRVTRWYLATLLLAPLSFVAQHTRLFPDLADALGGLNFSNASYLATPILAFEEVPPSQVLPRSRHYLNALGTIPYLGPSAPWRTLLLCGTTLTLAGCALLVLSSSPAWPLFILGLILVSLSYCFSTTALTQRATKDYLLASAPTTSSE